MSASASSLLVCVLLLATGAHAAINMSRPLIFAHRGYSGLLPEHTIEAYQAAIDAGADFVECDIVITKDCQLICRHEPNVLSTTNAKDVFPELITNKTVDGITEEGVYTTDMTLAQVQELTAIQRVPFRNQSYNNAGFKVPTVKEYLALLSNAPRTVGAVPEIKHPTFFDSQNLSCLNGNTITDLVAQTLGEYGYNGTFMSDKWMQKPILVQSFEIDNLKYLNQTYGIPAYQLIDEVIGRTADKSNVSYADMMTDAGLKNISEYAVVVAPWKNNFVVVDSKTNNITSIDRTFVPRAHAQGLLVNTWTFRNEPRYLANEFNNDPWEEYDLFITELGVDGIFTDFTGTAVEWELERGYRDESSVDEAALAAYSTAG